MGLSEQQRNRLQDWLDAQGLVEILLDNDLEEIDALVHLFECGLIKLPHWLEDDFYDDEE